MKRITQKKIEQLTREYGDAFYLLDSDVFEKNFRKLTESFTRYYSNFNMAYSYKTNYMPKLVKVIDRLGGYAEVVSDMEMDVALKAGVSYDRIIWNGPVKNKDRLREFLLNGGTVNIDSSSEFCFVRDVAMDAPSTQINVGIRCNYDVGDGVVSRFGVDADSTEFDDILSGITECGNIRLVNFQAHFAKRSPKFWTARTEGMLKIYDYALDKYGIKAERLDIGGGIYGDMPESLRAQLNVESTCFDDYAKSSAKLFSEHFAGTDNPPALFIEPGTALAGNSMRYVCRVETIKNIRGKAIAMANGSQKNISLSGLNPPMEVIACGEHPESYENIDIAGYTCIESDYLYKGYSGRLAVGDYLVFGNCGSYSIVMKPPFIFTNVPVIDISSDRDELIKRAETFDDLFGTYFF